MDTMAVDDRVRSVANPSFVGVVRRANPDGKSGYVHFDSDSEETDETFFHCSELEPE